MSLSVAEQIRWWSVGLVALILLMWALSGVLAPFLAGAAIAYFLDPLADRLERAGMSRTGATATITLLAAGLFSLLIVLLVPELVAQTRQLVSSVPGWAREFRQYLLEHHPEMLAQGSAIDTGVQAMQDNLKTWSATLLEKAWTSGLAILDFLSLLVITPVVAFYLLLDWDRMVARIDGWLPRDHLPAIRGIGRGIDSVLSGFVRGQLSVCAILGGFYAVALMVIGLDFGLIIGLFAGLMSFIPFVGAILGGLASIGLAAAQFWGDWGTIAAVAAVFAVGQAAEGNYLTPKLVGGSVGLHPVALMFALSAFGALLGFTGLLIAVPAAACIGVVGRFFLDQYLTGRLYRGYSGIADEGETAGPDDPGPDLPGPDARRLGP